MKRLIASATLLLVAACTPSAPDPAPSPANHVSIQGSSFAVSHGSWNNPRKANDYDFESWWSADASAPQWFEMTLPHTLPVAMVQLTVAQAESGPATHKISLENNHGDIVAWHRFDSENSNDGDTFTLRIDPPRVASKVRITSTRQPGWVAYRELRIISSIEVPSNASVAASGLVRPVYLTHAGDASGRLFVLEQDGRIRIVKNGTLLEAPFLDISQKLVAGHQMGLLGLVFPPDYAEQGIFYIAYSTKAAQNKAGQSVVSRLAVSANPDIADPGSEEVLLKYDQPGGDVHPVGTLTIGPRDDYLYIAVGDGTLTLEPISQISQDPATFQGSILRIDVSPGGDPYTIPPDNPFVGRPDHLPEIWATGLRNPWGIAFDRTSGALFIPDSGFWTREEVNYQPPDSGGGQNYGWPCFEGDVDTDTCHIDGAEAPIVAYGRDQGCVIVGGAVHDGRFIYADYCRGTVWKLDRNGESWKSTVIMQLNSRISSIGVDEDENIYAIGYSDGVLYRLHLRDSVRN